MTATTAKDVLGGKALWSADCADCLAWLRSLPDDCVDLVMTSPPYSGIARTYSIGFKLDGEGWVRWMFEVVSECVRVCKGLVAVVCEGKTKSRRYDCTPFLLMADLHRAGFNLRKPCVYARSGIPGSGGSRENGDWWRNDWEPVICVSRPGKLPWSDHLACGHAPKWAPGGEMSNRTQSGARVNQWGGGGTSLGRDQDGEKMTPRPSMRAGVVVPDQEGQMLIPGCTEGDEGPPPADCGGRDEWGMQGGSGMRRAGGERRSHGQDGKVIMTRPREGQHSQESTYYEPPAIANPGNVIRCLAGGGHMGSDLAHDNEAPFPMSLVEPFVLSFCPPSGVVCDPFLGSATSLHVAIEQGRRGIGCDVRESQCDLARRRLALVTPSLFRVS